MGLMKYAGWYSVSLLRSHPDLTFLFGDNLQGYGRGGQAIVRDEPNALGIPTKRHPSNFAASFFTDDNPDDLAAMLVAVDRALQIARGGRTVVVPVTDAGRVSLGLGLAQLDIRCPGIYRKLSERLDVATAPFLVTDQD